MIIHFPDKNFKYITVEFDTDTYTAVYWYHDRGIRRPCTLSRYAWEERLKEWKIDIQALSDYEMDIGL